MNEGEEIAEAEMKVKYGKQEMRDYVVGSLESSKW